MVRRASGEVPPAPVALCLSEFIPCHDEEPTVATVIEGFLASSYSEPVVVVADGSAHHNRLGHRSPPPR